jgi:hypothetical protein
LGQVIGQMKAVSCRMQLPHMRQLNPTPFAQRSKAVKARIGARFKLDDIAEAHRAAESRATRGATLIIP